jgi:toxin YoeB
LGGSWRDRHEKRQPAPVQGPRRAVLVDACLEDLDFWIANHSRTARKLLRILRETLKSPFEGNKAEPLRESLAGYWAKRLTEVDRIVYEVRDNEIIFIQARGHY